MHKKIILAGLMSLTLVLGALQIMAGIGGDCSAQQLNCCPTTGAELIHCQNMWNGQVFCAYDDDSVIDVTSCAAPSNGGNNGSNTETDESNP